MSSLGLTETPSTSEHDETESHIIMVESRCEEAAILLSEIEDINDHLYKFATQIRDPKTRLPSTKTRIIERLDHRTETLVEAYRESDENYIASLFQVSRSSSQLGPATFDAVLTKHDEKLIDRLVEANNCRRKRFAGWKRHEERVSEETDSALADAPDPLLPPTLRPHREAKVMNQDTGTEPISVPTTASALINPRAIDIDDNMSKISSTVSSRHITSDEDDAVIWPEPPRVQGQAKHFLCPYCYFICPRSTLERSQWMYAQPYVFETEF